MGLGGRRGLDRLGRRRHGAPAGARDARRPRRPSPGTLPAARRALRRAGAGGHDALRANQRRRPAPIRFGVPGGKHLMNVGVPTEIKPDEYRVALTPAGVRELVDAGHTVIVQSGAGEGSALPDDRYVEQGARLAADAELTRGLAASGATCVAYETVEDQRGRLPLLAPMSEVAGKIATQAGAFMLEKPLGGRGILLGGV